MSFKLIDSSNPVQEENVHKFEIPKEFCKPTGTSGIADSAGNSVMFLSLLSVFSKNWAIAIPTIVSSAICYTNYSPLKCSDATSPLTSLIIMLPMSSLGGTTRMSEEVALKEESKEINEEENTVTRPTRNKRPTQTQKAQFSDSEGESESDDDDSGEEVYEDQNEELEESDEDVDDIDGVDDLEDADDVKDDDEELLSEDDEKSTNKKRKKPTKQDKPKESSKKAKQETPKNTHQGVPACPEPYKAPPGQVSQNTLDFLNCLRHEPCNDRDWLNDEHNNATYKMQYKEFNEFTQEFVTRTIEIDDNMPPYPSKDLFMMTFSKTGRKGACAGYHLMIQPNNRTIFAAGKWQGEKEELQALRDNIVSNSTPLKNIIEGDGFVKYFGSPDPAKRAKGERKNLFGMDDELKVAPKGFAKDHQDIDLLKLRSFIGEHRFDDADVTSPDFMDKLMDIVRVSKPLVDLLNDWMGLTNLFFIAMADLESFNDNGNTPDNGSRTLPGDTSGGYSMKNWKAFTPFLGMYRDVSNRIPYYISDWTDAWNYRVIPSTLLIFFANILPALAFAFELQEKTGQYGVNEVLISTFMAAAGFSVLGAQPLTVVGVTGPITVLNTSIYTILNESTGPNPKPNYLQFVGWVYIIAAIMHFFIAIFNLSNWLRRTTNFTCQTFGFLVAFIYLTYGCQIMGRSSEADDPIESLVLSAFLAVTFLAVYHVFIFGNMSPYFFRHARRFLLDYGLPITVVAVSALPYWGRFVEIDCIKLPTVGGFSYTSSERDGWIIAFWNTPPKWVAIAIPFAALLTLLFYFDHQVSAIIGQGSEFKLKKPPGFHWDFFLLGVATLLAGVFGLVAPNGLIPQTPIHTESLVVNESRVVNETVVEEDQVKNEGHSPESTTKQRKIEVPVGVVEQRVTNLAQGGLALAFATGPFLQAVNKIPTGVLAGLFWSLGLHALYGNIITEQASYLLKDKHRTDSNDKYHKVRKSRIWLFLLFELVGFGATYAVTIIPRSAIGFPVIIILLIPFRSHVIPRLGFTQEELDILDGPAASDFTMAGLTL
ncbi:hypothetical protein E3Q22_00632 [Wallemia mellicola]|uniref:Bicarbonate transporter-like transmembrane domain-containing protein n=1 Tax=Wallemia mellicola TaxID=1708541 RepID=A0A4V4MH03_9BASI|nr:hypothetical protein E3Q22_00632 [Wallemia mellicola]TIB94363.1 hypothetical protein E3Q19_00372 [Wallemia mellicola]